MTGINFGEIELTELIIQPQKKCFIFSVYYPIGNGIVVCFFIGFGIV